MLISERNLFRLSVSLIFIVIYIAVHWLEYVLFPVMDDTKILTIQENKDNVIISGTSIKERNCRYIELEWYKVENGKYYQVNVTILEPRKSRGLGEFEWGDWRVDLSVADLNKSIAYVYHDCGLPWTTKTVFWKSPNL